MVAKQSRKVEEAPGSRHVLEYCSMLSIWQYFEESISMGSREAHRTRAGSSCIFYRYARRTCSQPATTCFHLNFREPCRAAPRSRLLQSSERVIVSFFRTSVDWPSIPGTETQTPHTRPFLMPPGRRGVTHFAADQTNSTECHCNRIVGVVSQGGVQKSFVGKAS